jgi:hypothetical protein
LTVAATRRLLIKLLKERKFFGELVGGSEREVNRGLKEEDRRSRDLTR